jgi:hypothetical protein
MNTKLKFAFEKETKGAVRYQEVGEDGAPAFAPQVGTLKRQDPENTCCHYHRRITALTLTASQSLYSECGYPFNYSITSSATSGSSGLSAISPAARLISACHFVSLVFQPQQWLRQCNAKRPRIARGPHRPSPNMISPKAPRAIRPMLGSGNN